ncbi:IS200/IS605 family transposase [Dethiosulfatibacter aminovorans]|uniref:IS200/IS605 family transposase n=1 Tax=Dethiosulfatibacter aminovorans TaxID=332095 RepID=UPI000932B6D6|nr:IS200/IS605 family transposase [Dethiosulfatibacter aminovorans]
MKENLVHSRTCVYNLNYHVVWSVKHRNKVLTPEIEVEMQSLVQEIAGEKGFIVHLFEVGERDHVHCFISAPPKISVSYMVKMLKGITARKLFIKYPELKKSLWKGVLWNHNYYVESIGSVSEENIRLYIEKQTNSY